MTTRHPTFETLKTGVARVIPTFETFKTGVARVTPTSDTLNLGGCKGNNPFNNLKMAVQ